MTPACIDSQNRFYQSLVICGSLVFLSFIMPGCDETFTPLQENDQFFFSIYGYLDTSADTQWVRVTQVRDSLYPSAEEIDATVTLENMNGGEPVVLHDSLFHYFHDGLAFNFWTSSIDLKPDEAYRLIAKRSDGMASQVIVTMPPDFPTPYYVDDGIIAINDIDNLVDVRTVYHLESHQTGEKRVVSFRQPNFFHWAGNEYRAVLDVTKDLADIFVFYPNHSITRRQVFIAAAGPEWPGFRTANPELAFLPKGISNIENGVGYLAGVVSKTIPQRRCFDSQGEDAPCPLEPHPF